MSSPPENEELKIDFEKFIKQYIGTSTSSNVTGDYRMYENTYYKTRMSEVQAYTDRLKIRDRSKLQMVEDSFYDWKYNPYNEPEIKLRGSVEIGSCTNTDKAEEPEVETPEEELQYFDPKDIDI